MLKFMTRKTVVALCSAEYPKYIFSSADDNKNNNNNNSNNEISILRHLKCNRAFIVSLSNRQSFKCFHSEQLTVCSV